MCHNRGVTLRKLAAQYDVRSGSVCGWGRGGDGAGRLGGRLNGGARSKGGMDSMGCAWAAMCPWKGSSGVGCGGGGGGRGGVCSSGVMSAEMHDGEEGCCASCAWRLGCCTSSVPGDGPFGCCDGPLGCCPLAALGWGECKRMEGRRGVASERRCRWGLPCDGGGLPAVAVSGVSGVAMEKGNK